MKERSSGPVIGCQKGSVVAVSVSETKGTRKKNVPSAELKRDYGIIGDAHAGGERQISLLAEESIKKMIAKGLKVGPGDFAENVTTKGIELLSLNIGSRLRIGDNAVLEMSHIGKDCRSRCSIYYQAGDCVMPREGVFAKVVKGGAIKPGDEVRVC